MSKLSIFYKINQVTNNVYGTIGAMCNILTESNFNSKNMQNCYEKNGLNDDTYTKKVDNGTYTEFCTDRIGYGLCQWTSSGRKTNLYNFAKANKKSIGDEDMQVDFLISELCSKSYKKVLEGLQNAKSIKEASDLFCTKFERPANQSAAALAKRASKGEALYKEICKGEKKSMIKIAIDAGHGSKTAGKRTPDGYKEHLANVKVANFFAQAMTRCGVAFIRTGWNDTNAEDDADLGLTARQKLIKNAECDYSISFHFNAFGKGDVFIEKAQGIETLISDKYPGDSLAMAKKIQNELIKGTSQKNRGVKTQALSMCNCKLMGTKASVLIECGFMTSQYESKLMKSDVFCLECAEEAAKGFCDYAGVKYVAGKTVVTTPTVPTKTTPTTSKTFRVRVIVDNLNRRNGPGVKYSITGKMKKGIYTITEVNGNWGKLKSGAGWISLSAKYVQKL